MTSIASSGTTERMVSRMSVSAACVTSGNPAMYSSTVRGALVFSFAGRFAAFFFFFMQRCYCNWMILVHADALTLYLAARSLMRSGIRRSKGLDEGVVKIHAIVKILHSDALVLAVGAIVIHIRKHAWHAVRRDAGDAEILAVAGAVVHHRHNRQAAIQ